MDLAAVSVLLLLFSVATAIYYDPSPNPEAVVQVGKARFTVLTDHLVRMEWGGANDAATLAFVNRNLPKPKFTTSKDGNWTIIQTSAVEVRGMQNGALCICQVTSNLWLTLLSCMYLVFFAIKINRV